MKDAYYLLHDSNARNDPRVLILRARHGASGYGVYFMVLEVLREQEGYRMPADTYLYDSLSIAVGVDRAQLEAVVGTCVEVGLLKKGEYLYSESLLRRMEKLDRLRDARSRAGHQGNLSRWGESQVRQVCDPIATGLRSQNIASIGKVSKVKSRVVGSDRFTPPTLEEVQSYCKERGKNIDPDRWYAHYQAVGWRVGRNPMKDWRAAVRTWERGDQFRPGTPATREEAEAKRRQDEWDAMERNGGSR